MRRRALVVGGGIAGPASALALQKAGAEVVLAERRAVLAEEEGSWFTVAPNGVDALDALGAGDLVRALGLPTRGTVMRGATGRELGRVGLGGALADGTPALTMKRSVLGARLVQECRARGIEVRLGSAVEAGSARVGFDLVVGADGVHSRLRRAIDPAAPSARYVGLVNFGGVTPGGARGLTPAQSEPEVWHFVFGRRAFFGHHVTPAGDVVWFVNEPRPLVTPEERRATTDAQWRDHLVDLFDEREGPARELIGDGVLELAGDSTHDLAHVPRWHRDGVLVVGDAAHAPAPSSGQGASLALEDAVALGRCIRDLPSVEAALDRFEELRRSRVEKVVAYGARSSSSKTTPRLLRPLSETVLRLVFRFAVTDARTEWLYGHRSRWEDPARDGLAAAR